MTTNSDDPLPSPASAASVLGYPWKISTAAAVLALVVLLLAAYADSLRGAFVFDDLAAIVRNPHLDSFRPLARVLSAPPDTTPAGRPLVCLSLAANYAIGGLDPRGYHVFNLLVHVLAALALFGLVRRALALPGGAIRWTNDAAGPSDCSAFAFAAAALWMLHPLQTESVTYVVQRAESMMGLCYWLTLYAAARAAGSAAPWSAGWWAWTAGSIAACFAGVLCKESMVTAPAAVVLFDRAFLARPWRELFAKRWPLYLGLFATWVPVALLVAGGYRTRSVGGGLFGITPWVYLKTQFGVILHYLALVFWPSPLVLDYAWPVARGPGEYAPAALGLAALLAGVAVLWRWKPALGFVGAFFFLALAPTSSFVPIATEIAAEHRLYLSLAAPIILAVAAACFLARKVPAAPGVRRGVLAALLALTLAAEGTATWRRNRDYSSELAIWTDTVARQPSNPRALVNLAHAWENAGRPDRALGLLAASLELQPANFEALYNHGTLLARAGRAVEAADCLEAAVELRPDNTDARINLGGVRQLLGDRERAREAYRAALALDPAAAGAHYNLARLDALAGDAASACGHLAACLRADPANAEARRLAEAIHCPAASAAAPAPTSGPARASTPALAP